MMRPDQFPQIHFLISEFLLRAKRVLMVLEGNWVHGKAIAEASLFKAQLAKIPGLLDFFHVFLIVLKLISSDSRLPLNLEVFSFFQNS